MKTSSRRLRLFQSGIVGWFCLVLLAGCRSGPTPDTAIPSGAVNPPLKIVTAESGVYAITLSQLQRAGWQEITPSQVQLFYRDRRQPLWVDGQGKDLTFRFYAQAVESRYTRDNVYWLYSAPSPPSSPPPPLSAASVPPPATSFLASARLEENHLYQPLVESGDHWLWLTLPAPKAQTFEMNLSALDAGSAQLQIEVWGSTEAPASPDHHLRLSFNGRQLADEFWDGKGRHSLQVEVPSDLLQEGENVILLEAPGDTGVPADSSFVDWIELRYPRRLVAENDRLEFTSPGGEHTLSGFSGSVSIYDVTDPQAAALAKTSTLIGENVTFLNYCSAEGIAGHRYLAVGQRGILTPRAISPAAFSPDLRASRQGADYLALGPADLLAPLQPLLQSRSAQGLQPQAIPIEAIYDQFGEGLPQPEAVQNFLRFAVQNWQPAPRFVLLVGDATHDPLGYTSDPQANRLPTFFVNTVFGGETASDVIFTQLDEDALPDLAIGRLPARTPRQVQMIVEKILAYEQSPRDQEWQTRILAIADGQEPSFQADAQAFLDLFSDLYSLELFAPLAGAGDSPSLISARLQNGNLLVAYFGHGSVKMWGKDQLFTVEDVSRLNNGERLPVVLNLTCLTGLFTHPKVASLAEALLWKADGGAVAVFAPTSLTLPGDQSFLTRAFGEAFLAEPNLPLGDLLLEARRQIPVATAGALDVMQTFLLFGDPAMKLAVHSSP